MPLFGSNYPDDFSSQTGPNDPNYQPPGGLNPAPPPALGAPILAPVNGNYQLGNPGGGVSSGGGNGAGAIGFDPGKAQFDFGRVPGFTAPKFAAPDLAAAQNEPGYQFRLKSGSDALERSAAAKGTVRTGGNLKNLLEYGQNFGSQEYGNVYNRALQAYDRQYQGAKDQYAPQLAEWQLRNQAEAQAALLQKSLGFQAYTFANRGSGGGGGGGGVPDPEPQWYSPFGGGG